MPKACPYLLICFSRVLSEQYWDAINRVRTRMANLRPLRPVRPVRMVRKTRYPGFRQEADLALTPYTARCAG